MLRKYVDDYLDRVVGRVKWKKAHHLIRRELDDHLTDQYEAYVDAGEDTDTAAQKAVLSMGDADVIGDELNAVYRPKIDVQLIVMTVLVFAAGMLGQCLYRLAVGPNSIGGAVPGMVCGCIVMVVCALFDVNRMKNRPWLWFFGYLALVVLTLAMSSDLNGKRISVINTPLHTGYMVILAPIVWAAVIHKLKNRGTMGVLLCGGLFFLPIFAALMTPSIFGALIIIASGLVLLGYAIAKGWFGKKKWLYALIVYVPTLVATIIVHRRLPPRFTAYLSLKPLPDSAEYWWGNRLREMLSHTATAGAGTTWEFFEQMNYNGALADFKLTVLIYGYGWIVLPILAALMLACGYCIARVIRKQNTMFGKLLGLSTSMLLLMQCISAILTGLAFVINTDYPLPFLGGNYTWLYNSLLIGILLSLSRHNCLTSETADRIGSVKHQKRLFEIDNGKLIIYLR